MTNEKEIAAPTVTEIGKRVEILLNSPDSSPELERAILWKVLESIKDVVRLQRRVTISMAGIAAMFELLNRSLVGEFSITDVKVNDLDFLRAVAPAAVAYCLFRFSVLARDLGIYNSIYDHLTYQRFHGMHESELDRVLAAFGGPTVGRPPPSYMPKFRVIGDAAVAFQAFLSVAGPLLFIAYGLWQVHQRDGFDLLAWTSFGISIAYVLFAASFAVITINIDRWSFGRQFDFNLPPMVGIRAPKKTNRS